MYPAGRAAAPPDTKLHALAGTGFVELGGALVLGVVEEEGDDEW
jgi:hypothetical protein